MDATVDWALAQYPQAQLRRSRWTDLRGPWLFALDDEDRGIQEGWPGRAEVFDREILVPFPPESLASGVHERGYHPVVWYRRVFELSPVGRTPRLHLTFGAVDYEAQVWVNGHFAGRHEGGHTPFTLDITAWLTPETGQVIVVRVHDDPLDLPSRAGNSIGNSSQQKSGITGRPASGSRSGWSR